MMSLHPGTIGALDELHALVCRLTRASRMGPSSLRTERFIWRVTYRDNTWDSETQGEGFGRVRAWDVARIELVIPQLTTAQGGEVGIHHLIPLGAAAVFTRRRGIALHLDGRPTDHLLGWTIIGHRWPNGTGRYFFYHNTRDECFTSPDFDDPRGAR